MMNSSVIFAGVDIGSTTTKAVFIDGSAKILATSCTKTGVAPEEAAARVLADCCEIAGCSADDIAYSVSTGYGRELIESANEQYTEIACHAKGANYWFPEARGVIDIGGQDSKAIAINKRGGIVDFAMNDKCAAGTGRFLDVMAGIMALDVGEMGRQSLLADKQAPITSMCTVFAESEVISHIAKKVYSPYEIMAGVNNAVARRVNILVEKVGLDRPIVMTGGVAKNAGIVHEFERILNTKLLVPDDPQGVGALGAALIARDKGRNPNGNGE